MGLLSFLKRPPVTHRRRAPSKAAASKDPVDAVAAGPHARPPAPDRRRRAGDRRRDRVPADLRDPAAPAARRHAHRHRPPRHRRSSVASSDRSPAPTARAGRRRHRIPRRRRPRGGACRARPGRRSAAPRNPSPHRSRSSPSAAPSRRSPRRSRSRNPLKSRPSASRPRSPRTSRRSAEARGRQPTAPRPCSTGRRRRSASTASPPTASAGPLHRPGGRVLRNERGARSPPEGREARPQDLHAGGRDLVRQPHPRARGPVREPARRGRQGRRQDQVRRPRVGRSTRCDGTAWSGSTWRCSAVLRRCPSPVGVVRGLVFELHVAAWAGWWPTSWRAGSRRVAPRIPVGEPGSARRTSPRPSRSTFIVALLAWAIGSRVCCAC